MNLSILKNSCLLLYYGRDGYIGISEYLWWLLEQAKLRIKRSSMLPSKLENATPTVYTTKSRSRKVSDSDMNPNIVDPIDAQEIFDYIRLHFFITTLIFSRRFTKFVVTAT